MKVTVITMYRADDAEIFTHVVEGELTAEQKKAWRKAHSCDEFAEQDEVLLLDFPNNMFFRVLDVSSSQEPCGLLNVDGEISEGQAVEG